ncbi:thiol:disulfide interchange protein DsbG [Stenotrophomonas beteli]|uniref:Thiol:disulfide interchange protein n=1 Tax=Stenotrophomonas beteli TaxID=3384461 RepID=A0A0R0B2Y7_9GAMM|nr:thiol:disulfide interchange protein DsbG [Stenotrophomonas maltophilia]KRG51611.1 dihydroneopterin aldolase [Stenotrophomonas maltophilia]
MTRPVKLALATTLLASLSFLPGCSEAAPPSRPGVLKTLEAQGLTIVGGFQSAPDVQAFAGAAGGRPVAVYVLKDGSAIVGTRVGADGAAIDEAQLSKLVTGPMGAKAWSDLAQAAWIQDGKPDAPKILYVFTDANCPYCHQFWEAARPWVNSGKVQLRHVMVGVIRADSPAKAAAIMTAKDPSAALLHNELNQARGGIPALASIPPEVAKKLQENHALMESLGFSGTPGIVGKQTNGELQKVNGMPRAGALEALLGPR